MSTDTTLPLPTSQRNLDIILQNIIDIVLFLDDRKNVILVNDAFYDVFNCSPDAIINKAFSEAVCLKLNREPITLDEVRVNAKDVRQSTAISDILHISCCSKSIFGTIAITSIVTDEGSERTILTIHDKTKEHDLEDMKLDFVSMAAHELRTPITSIRGYASLMLEEIGLGDSIPVEDWKLLLSRISVSAEQLLALVENLLNVTKIEKGVLSLSCKDEDWQKCVRTLVDGFDERARSRNITLVYEHSPEQMSVYVDRMRIEEVLSNLISNALTYTQEGGTVTVWCKRGADGSSVETYVKDNGPGIPKAAQSHLFEKFFRVSGPLEQGSKGNGLGLYISKSIVTMHNGKIWVDSDEGKGATFIFTVPLSSA